MALTFTREDVPKVTRAGGSGREPEAWEKHLAPLKETPNEGFRVWTYEPGPNKAGEVVHKKSSAISRKSAVADRLRTAVAGEHWQLDVRVVPGDESKPENEQRWGVYVTYKGEYTPEQIVANAKAHDERSRRVIESRSKAKAERENGSGDEAEATADNVAAVPEAETERESAKTRAQSRKAS